MKRILRLVATAGAVSLMLVGTALVSPASAAPQPTCGGNVGASVTLTGNLSCGGANSGIKLASGVTLDCNGYSIMANPAVKGEGPGITVKQKSTVTNCVVKYFDAGIYIQPGGGGNVISANTTQDNIGIGNYGDGIVMDTSSNNQITGNTVSHNGPFDGIGMVGKSTHNLIQYNTVSNNNVPNGGGQDDGIRVEGPGAADNKVLFNTVSGNGLDGIAVFGTGGDVRNEISGNSVTGNGFNNVTRPGNGIMLFQFGNETKVTTNTVTGNSGSGIEVHSRFNTITGNVATGNKLGGGPGQAYDLYDFHFNCDQNVWSGNTWGTKKPACVA